MAYRLQNTPGSPEKNRTPGAFCDFMRGLYACAVLFGRGQADAA